MKLISWNVNGFRAALTKGFQESFYDLDADMFCIQETKMQPEQVTTSFDGYARGTPMKDAPSSRNMRNSVWPISTFPMLSAV